MMSLTLFCVTNTTYTTTYTAAMTSVIPLLWRHWPLYYDVTDPSTMTSIIPLLWRHWPLYSNSRVSTLTTTILSPRIYLSTPDKESKTGDTLYAKAHPVPPLPGFRTPRPMVYAGLYPIDQVLYPIDQVSDVTNPSTMTSLTPLLWRH